MHNTFDKAILGRALFYDKKLQEAIVNLEECFINMPAAWWLLMEICRASNTLGELERQNIPNLKIMQDLQIFFDPDYSSNSYQQLLYNCAASYNAVVAPCSGLNVQQIIAARKSSQKVVFHQHWLREIYRGCTGIDDGINFVDRYVSSLKTLKAFGVPIVWTVHNLFDHDLQDFEKVVCKYAISSVAAVADIILLHTESTRAPLMQLTAKDISKKCHVIGHPLYSELLSKQKSNLPVEINLASLVGKKVFLCLGMIRPYKGVSELLDVYENLLTQNNAGDSCLVIAGRMIDEEVRKKSLRLKSLFPDRVYVVPRVLSEEEISALYSIADVAVMPYRAILISGSYYLATTFSVPSIAPDIGMFQDAIEKNVTGFKYNASGDGLMQALLTAIKMNKDELKMIGEKAYKIYNYRTAEWFSKQYFNTLVQLFNSAIEK